MSFEPKEVRNYDDSYTGYEYGNHVADFLRDASNMDDHNLPIKLIYQREGITRSEVTYPSITLHRFLPRHGIPVVLVAYGANVTPEVFDRLAVKMLDFYGRKAVRVQEWGERGKHEELTVRLGSDPYARVLPRGAFREHPYKPPRRS
jgi:hypothetical protein